MNKLTAASVFSAALMFTGLALAQQQDVAPAKTRAEVIAELQQARDSGELAVMHSEVGVNGFQTVVSAQAATKASTAVAAKPAVAAPVKADAAPAATTKGKTRAEVVSELRRARESGELAALHAEIGLGVFPSATTSRQAGTVLAE